MEVPSVKSLLNYNDSKIYQIYCFVTKKRYIGSTTTTLKKRLRQHELDYKCYINNSGNRHYVSSYDILKNNNYAIALIENFPCETKVKLLFREAEYIKQNECVNINAPIKTIEEKEESLRLRKEKYAERKKEINKIWYENNKNRRNRKIRCVCGTNGTVVHYKGHCRTKSHLKFMSANPNVKETYEFLE